MNETCAAHPIAQPQRADWQRARFRTGPQVSHLVPSSLGRLQRSVGNRAMNRLLSSRTILPKLTVGPVDDEYEREADHIAELAMRAPQPDIEAPLGAADVPETKRKCTCGGSGEVAGQCTKCAKKEELQRSAEGPSLGSDAPSIVQDVIRSPGQPLDGATRAFFEPRFGRDLSHVRLHEGYLAGASAASVNALAYTVGHHIVFGVGQFFPDGRTGQSLLAHEIVHVLQQTEDRTHSDAHSAVSHLQRKAGAQDEALAKSLVDAYLAYPRLDIQGLALSLNVQLALHKYEFVRTAFEHIPDDLQDNVAAEMVSRITDLAPYAATPDGRRTLNVLYEAMITGNVSKFEREQSERILAATRISKEEYLAQAEKPMVVYPIREQGFLRDCYSTFRADLLPSGQVKVEFTSTRIWSCDMFKREVATFAPYGGTGRPLIFSPETLVGVRLYDQGGAFATVPAIALIDFANQLRNKTLSLAATAFFTGLTLGAGALGAGSVAALETEVAAGEASGAMLWGARVLLWADRVATVLPIVTEMANENRDWIMENVPGGPAFLEALDEANAIAGYYGWARLGFDGLRFMKAQMTAAWAARQAGGIPEALSSSEREILSKIDHETEIALKQLNDGEKALADDAVEYVTKHPEEVKGPPGQRHASVGEGHEIVEVPGGCELHSPGGLGVPCPKWGTSAVEGGAKRRTAKAPKDESAKAPAPAPKEQPAKPAKAPRKPKKPRRLDPGRLSEYRFISELKERYPKLRKLDIRPKARPSSSRYEGAPESSFEERMQTTQGKYSLAIYNEEGKVVIELDGISPEGWVQEIKIEQKFHKVDEIVAQLRRQSDFAEAYGLEGVEYSIASPDPYLVEEVEAQVVDTGLRNVRNVHEIP